MDRYELTEKLERAKWILAKKTRDHEYTLSKTWDRREFEETVKAIRKYGKREKFWGKDYIYFYANGYKYWTMGEPIGKTILINRVWVKYSNEYDKYADEYDYLYSGEEYKKQDFELRGLLSVEGSVLDVGCGTGLGAELFNGKYDSYVGIDESYKCIEIAKKKFQDIQKFINVPIRDFYMRGFDTIISLYGAMSYLTPDEQWKVYRELGGKKFYLMYYKDGYTPKTKTNLKRYKCVLPLKKIDFYNYEIRSNDEDLFANNRS